MIHDLYDGLDNKVISAIEGMDMVRMDDVRASVDELGEKVLRLEEGVAEMKHFHTFKPDEVDEAYAHISTPMGVHTAPRDPIPHVTPADEEKMGVDDSYFAEEYTPEVPTGEKTFSKKHMKAAVPSRHMVTPDTPAVWPTEEMKRIEANKPPNIAFYPFPSNVQSKQPKAQSKLEFK